MQQVVKLLAEKIVPKPEMVAVLIQTSGGKQYILDKAHFVTRRGRTIARRGFFETPARAVARVMKYLNPTVQTDQYMIFRPRSLGKYRTHFVVWFVYDSEFNAHDPSWEGHLLSVEAEDALRSGQLKAVRIIAAKAYEMFQQRVDYRAA